MTKKEQLTEDIITDAAREVFIEKGMSGARMQEIADRAGINKSLLHYYFRSKEKLFAFIFTKLLSKIGGMLSIIMQDGVSIEDKLKQFSSTYIDILLKNPFLPNFIFNEITRNPQVIIDRFAEAKIEPSIFLEPLEKQLKLEGYQISAQDFIINTISLIIFPIAAKPILEHIAFNGNKKEYKNYIISRKESVTTFVLNALEGYRTKN